MNVERLAIWAAAGVGIQVGAAMVATRLVVGEVTPTTLALLRYVIGSICLLAPLALLRRRPRVAMADLGPIALLGIGQFAALVVLLNAGLRTVPAARAAVIFASMPLLTMLIAAALGREALTATKTIGVCLTMLGVALAFGEKLFEPGGQREWLGAVAVLASALCGAVCSVFYRPYLQRYPTLEVSAIAMGASVTALAVVAVGEGGLSEVLALSGPGWAAVVFIGLSSGLGYVLWLWALGRASPTRVTVFLSLSPLAAAGLGVVVLGERPSVLLLFGLVAVVAGLWAAHRDRR